MAVRPAAFAPPLPPLLPPATFAINPRSGHAFSLTLPEQAPSSPGTTSAPAAPLLPPLATSLLPLLPSLFRLFPRVFHKQNRKICWLPATAADTFEAAIWQRFRLPLG